MTQPSLETIKELNEEFKIILNKVHPYFRALKSTNNESKLCQKWLHKLFKADKQEMKLRNAYLLELLNQLRNGKLNEPFNKSPKTKGLLLPLPITQHKSMQNFYIECQTMTKKNVYNSVRDVLNGQIITDVDHEYVDNFENSNGHNKEEIEKKDDLNYKQKSDFIDISESSNDLQRRNQTADKSDGGDGCALDRETEIKLESFEKASEELQVKHELLVNRLQAVELQADANASDANQMVATVIAELTKFKRDLDAMDDREAIKASEDSKQFDILGEKIAQVEKHICQFMAEARDLRGLVEDACDHKQIVKDMMESVEHLKEQHRAQMDEKNSRIDEQLCAFETEMDELEARVELNRPGRATAVVGTIGEHDDDDDNDDNDTIISQ